MKKSICIVSILLMVAVLVPTAPAEAYRGHGHGWFLPGLIIGGALAWSLTPRYYYPPPSYYYPPPAYYYPPPAYSNPPPTYAYPQPSPTSPAPSTPPPSGGSATWTGGQIFIYPRQGQSLEKQETDRTDCHKWAVGQIDYDPTNAPPSGMSENTIVQKSADYHRALGACLDARGYSMR